jgi:predicted AlkP superfamily pyrophosphatase or phosphodiesterase
MGMYNLEKSVSPDSFLRSHVRKQITSVYPTTTEASTTAIASGLEPCESGWLGWNQYFVENEDGKQGSQQSFMQKYCPYLPVVQLINEHSENLCEQFEDGKISDPRLLKITQAQTLSSFGDEDKLNLQDLVTEIENICTSPGHHYLECYYDQPDAIMHKLGIESKTVKTEIQEINSAMENLYQTVNEKKTDDTLFIISGTHGHIKAEPVVLSDYSKITECLKDVPSLDSRAISFFVKEGLREKFSTLFKKEFGKDYLLLSKQEVIDKHIFGAGGNEESLKKEFPDKKDYTDFIGDYVGIATGNGTIFSKRNRIERGMNGGLTKEELMIPLIIVE